MSDDDTGAAPALTPGHVSDLLSLAGLEPRKGESRRVMADLLARGITQPDVAALRDALQRVRAEDPLPRRAKALPGGLDAGALTALARDTGLALTAEEASFLARRLPADATADALRDAVRDHRRTALRQRLDRIAEHSRALPLRRSDVVAALATIETPDLTDDALLARLCDAARARLRDLGSADEALTTAWADLRPAPGRTEASLEAMKLCAHLVAEAFALDPVAAARFVNRADTAAREDRRAARQAAQDARALRAEQDRRQREWEASLVTRDALPGLLGCTAAEADRWILDRRIPIARRMRLRRGGREAERLDFDPKVIEPLRGEVAAWREEDARQQALRGAYRSPARGPEPAGRAPALPRIANAVLAKAAAMDRYAAHFKTARALDRRITLITGPTNSGKTHAALMRLAAGESGTALAPLRLLAHEFRESLAALGIPASLSTGEERDIVPGARFSCATVEMCPFATPMDVALVDEAQLLDDPDRGHAWTAAIMGVPAREVVVLGSPDCVPMVRRIAELCGDPVSEITLERKTPLVAAKDPLKLSELRQGDALIAFSRREVLELRGELQRMNRRVACVYGALSPEVRRAEARRFREGEADILIATDAIGLGLNLGPLARVVFSALEKWDGKERRRLSAAEIKQIGGRAGRYGNGHEAGIVAALVGAGRPEMIALALGARPAAPDDLRPRVGPDADIVATVAAEMNTTSLYATLTRLQRAVLRPDDPNYRLADISPQIEIAAAIDRLPLSLGDRWTYALCPVDVRDHGVNRLAAWAQSHAQGATVSPPTLGRLSDPAAPSPDDLERAEKGYRRLVAWRWLHLRFPDAYADIRKAEAESNRLNAWIETCLATRPARRRAR